MGAGDGNPCLYSGVTHNEGNVLVLAKSKYQIENTNGIEFYYFFPDPRYLFGMFTLTQHGDYDVMVRFQFLSSTDERNSLSVTLFYTQNNSDVDFTSWNNVTLAFDDVIDVINSTSNVDRSQLNKIHINYFFIVGGLDLNTFYYVRLQIKFRESPFNSKPFMTPPWAVFFPGRPKILSYYFFSFQIILFLSLFKPFELNITTHL